MSDSQNQQSKLWAGRFAQDTNKALEQFSQSVSFDWKLYDVDIDGSIAHAKMLEKISVLSSQECLEICEALQQIRKEIDQQGLGFFDPSLEDVHMNIESRLTQKIGQAGQKLHTGRSRNDQVVLDLRLKMKRQWIPQLSQAIQAAQKSLLQFCLDNQQVIIPEFTHTQHAQPVLLAHHMLAYVQMLARDAHRLDDCLQRVDVMPLGSGACTGSGLPLDRAYVQELLGFSKLSQNSVDAVSDRDFVQEFLFDLSLIATHLSRVSEELILWSSTEFAYVELPDQFCTGSSMMPQKKNADALELIRGNCASVFGDLMAMLSLVKSLPLAYNRDMQDDKRRLFETHERVLLSLQLFSELMVSVQVDATRCAQMAKQGFACATDLSDYLVKKACPFRKSHEIVGKLVAHCIEQSLQIEDLPLESLKTFSDLFEQDVYEYMSLEHCVESKDVVGGTAPKQVQSQLEFWKKELGVNQ